MLREEHAAPNYFVLVEKARGSKARQLKGLWKKSLRIPKIRLSPGMEERKCMKNGGTM